VAETLASIGPLPVLTSPLRRTRETAAALEARWPDCLRVEPRVSEIPSPAAPEGQLADRGRWLARVMSGTWDDGLSEAVLEWRQCVLTALHEVVSDAVVVTHFVAINAAVGEARGDRRAVVFRPDYCSHTVIDNGGGRLAVVELGRESSTVVR
jgi:broad specificity phosphatase PhoE